MGTTFKLTFYTSSDGKAVESAAAAFKRINELNNIFSDYSADSEASKLAANAGKKISVSTDLWYLIKLSKKISKQTNGAFDVTVGPLTKLWRHAIRQQQFPDSNQIAQAKALVNYRWIKLYPGSRQVKLKKQGMKLDFGAIAKGYAIDQAYGILKKLGITRALVDGGGDLYIGDAPPYDDRWEIKDHNGKVLEVVLNKGIASSGDSYQHLKWDGAKYSHIIDPHRGIGLQNTRPVTIQAPSATIADALASALSVLGESASKKLLKKYRAHQLN
jgi:thiamine biosynthesis lipoprotein